MIFFDIETYRPNNVEIFFWIFVFVLGLTALKVQMISNFSSAHQNG